MPRCPSCSIEAPDGSHFCPSCGAALGSPSALPTVLLAPRSAGAAWVGRGASRFLPGTTLGGRYRIVGMLGRGGMGEVYRADDLKIGQEVALKFLPVGFESDPDRLQRLMGEIRTARQVTHPNVCRVYDLGEADGQHFLTMEYVDGDDLASLLRRIGRLPPDKAVEIARQICAGLAAAHEQGILHRDLKPANVMLDGRGRVRITDFGLAGMADRIQDVELGSGTPAYMAPEQLERKEVTPRSDIYALGLVLYELFTGKSAFDGRTPEEMARLQRESTPATPTSLVRDLDPAVEGIILRCLERDPAARPSSVLSVAAALPGGDPLAAALAAGETPSPEMVAAAGGEGALRPAVAFPVLLFVLIGIPLVAVLNGQWSLIGRVPLDLPPQALAERARQIASDFGYPERPADSEYGLERDDAILRHIAEQDRSARRWDRLADARPSALAFWYRQSPRLLVPSGVSGRVHFDDPPARITGMVDILLDPQGRLHHFRAVPPERDEQEGPTMVADWDQVFAAAGLERTDFAVATPQWLPEAYADERVAWIGKYPGQPEPAIRVEASAYRGKPVFFDIIHPWDRPTRMESPTTTRTQRIQLVLGGILNLVLLLGSFLLARRNLRLGRGDRKGAFRLGGLVFVATLLIWVFRASHVPDLNREVQLLLIAVALGLLNGSFTWLIYMVLEPFVRRRWPQSLVSWTRLLAGRFRDPLVGKHLLLGAALGVAFALLTWLAIGIPALLGQPHDLYRFQTLAPLLGTRAAAAGLIGALQSSLLVPMILLFVLMLLRMFLRNSWVAFTVFVLVWTLVLVPPSVHPWSWIVVLLASIAATGLVLMRYGLVPLIASHFVGEHMLGHLPVTLSFSAWYAAAAAVALIAAAALALYAFRVSLGGKPLIADELAEA